MHHLDSWIKTDQLDITCIIISLFNAQHVSDVSTSILMSLRLICSVISWVVLLWCDVCWCYVVVWLGWCGICMQAEVLLQPAYRKCWCKNSKHILQAKLHNMQHKLSIQNSCNTIYIYTLKIVCFRYIIANTLHKGDNKDNNGQKLAINYRQTS